MRHTFDVKKKHEKFLFAENTSTTPGIERLAAQREQIDIFFFSRSFFFMYFLLVFLPLVHLPAGVIYQIIPAAHARSVQCLEATLLLFFIFLIFRTSFFQFSSHVPCFTFYILFQLISSTCILANTSNLLFSLYTLYSCPIQYISSQQKHV